MAKLTQMIECPEGKRECLGLPISVNEGGIGMKTGITAENNSYTMEISIPEAGTEEVIMNCPNYQECYRKNALQTAPLRESKMNYIGAGK